jgi:predicted phosphodiesterase
MRIAALYDIHGNLPALEAVLAELPGLDVDEVVLGGDVLPGPMPAECLERLRHLPQAVRCLRGNGEADTLTAADGLVPVRVPEPYREPIVWGAGAIGPAQVAALRTWPATIERLVPGVGRVLFCHATPRSDVELFTRITPEARILPAFDGVSSALVVCGHTHMPFDRMIGGLRVVNAGSVGMPFGEPGACWLLIDAGGPRLMRTAFDREAAARRIRATTYPGAEAFAANHVLSQPAEAQMIAAFERSG